MGDWSNRTGSSPRGRGTACTWLGASLNSRFIPAWAGNSQGPGSRKPGLPVHPRVGGEQLAWRRRLEARGGSSPRGRGTGAGAAAGRQSWRFIPAWAGNSPIVVVPRLRAAVHPRVGGEQLPSVIHGVSVNGSSPRGRGTVTM